MIKKIKGLILIGICTMILAVPLSAQLKYGRLIFSEVYLNANEPAKSWLEIYNPTTESLILESFRFYSIKTKNILPEEIQKKGGIEITSGECLILCANKAIFDLSVMENLNLVQVSAMTHFGKGGFFSLKTKNMGEEGEDIFRYGNPEETSKLKKQLGNFVVPFSKGNISYTRVKNNKPGEKFMTNFTQTEPSPGYYLKY